MLTAVICHSLYPLIDELGTPEICPNSSSQLRSFLYYLPLLWWSWSVPGWLPAQVPRTVLVSLGNIALLNLPPAPQLSKMGIHATELDPARLCSNRTTLPAIGHLLWSNVNTYINEFLTKRQTALLWLSTISLKPSIPISWYPWKESGVPCERASFRSQAAFPSKMWNRWILMVMCFQDFCVWMRMVVQVVQVCLRDVLCHGRNAQDRIHS